MAITAQKPALFLTKSDQKPLQLLRSRTHHVCSQKVAEIGGFLMLYK